MTRIVVTHVERNDANRVAGNQEEIFLFVVKREGKNTIQILHEMNALFLVKSQDDFTVRTCLEFIIVLQLFTQFAVVVNLTIDA